MTQSPRQPKNIPKKKVRLDCGRYLLRTAMPADASDQWAAWMTNPRNLRLVNSKPKGMTKDDVATYIGQFDQRSHLLIGIFEKHDSTPVGFFRIDIDYALRRCLLFAIGEPRYRHAFLLESDLKVPFCDFVFETLDLRTMLVTVLASNRALTGYLLRIGWSLDQTLRNHVKSELDGTMLDLCLFSYSRDAWRAWKAQNAALTRTVEPETPKGEPPVT
jgi:RimJ/RimL family protein N-acetyltransferase